MKKILSTGLILGLLLGSMLILNSCNDSVKASEPNLKAISNSILETPKTATTSLSEEFKAYWYSGEAEITSFELEQARYGEIRKGTAVHIFVTEPFLAEKQVKANYSSADNIPVLKLNSTKKYLTGIYPYSIMSSSFYPVRGAGHALKISNSVQEWCGQVYTQLNNRDKFNILSHSYFEGEADQHLSLEKSVLEDELWNMIRIQPESLPTGNFKAIPSLEFLRLSHNEIKTYEANAEKQATNGLVTYTLNFPELDRSLEIVYKEAFPFQIEEWTDRIRSGYGSKAKTLSSHGKRIKSIKTPYWRKNSNKDVALRDILGLP